MRFYTIDDLNQDVASKLGNGSPAQVQSFYGRVDEGRRKMLKQVEPPELVRKAYLEEALYDQVNKYAVPEDLEYTSVINIRKLSGYRNVDRLSRPLEQVFRRRFDQKRLGSRNVFSINYTNGVKTMSIFRPKGLKQCTHKVISKADSLTECGTWNVGGNVVNLTLDKLKHITGHAALKFDINASSTSGFIECLLTNPSDIYDFYDTGAVFAWLDIPAFKFLTSVKLTLESAPGQYYEMTVNAPHDGNVFANNWNLLKYQFNSMNAVNAPNPRAITKFRFDFTTTGIMNGCHLDNIIARKGEVYEADYQSAYIILDANSGAWKKRATSPTDIIVAEEDTYQILMVETAISVLEEATSGSEFSSSHISRLRQELDGIPSRYRGSRGKPGAYDIYKMAHPSEQILMQDTSYIFGNLYDGLSEQPIYDNQSEYGEGEGESDNNYG